MLVNRSDALQYAGMMPRENKCAPTPPPSNECDERDEEKPFGALRLAIDALLGARVRLEISVYGLRDALETVASSVRAATEWHPLASHVWLPWNHPLHAGPDRLAEALGACAGYEVSSVLMHATEPEKLAALRTGLTHRACDGGGGGGSEDRCLSRKLAVVAAQNLRRRMHLVVAWADINVRRLEQGLVCAHGGYPKTLDGILLKSSSSPRSVVLRLERERPLFEDEALWVRWLQAPAHRVRREILAYWLHGDPLAVLGGDDESSDARSFRPWW